jgi:delta14-sterol reductase
VALHFPESITLESLAWAALAFSGFIVTLWLGSVYLPGPIHSGVVSEGGIQKKYKLNGFALFLTVFVLVALDALLGVFSLASIHRHFLSLLIVANVFAFVVSLLLYRQGKHRASMGETGHSGPVRAVLDIFYGVEKNPEWFGMDLKMFSYRPSLIGLGLINAAFAFVQYEKYGFLTAQMCLYQLFYFLYLANYFQFEHGMLFTWDIIEERFGWMLVWGDYALVPFFYSIAGWYLVDHLDPLPLVAMAGHVALFSYGFWLFRGANGQKHAFKRDPQTLIWGKPAHALGGKLLVSGFWGIGRKLNYTGELCMYASWTLLCGFSSGAPYLLPLLLLCLFVHRAWRDDKRCRAKYGALWIEYCRRARFRMFPYVY